MAEHDRPDSLSDEPAVGKLNRFLREAEADDRTRSPGRHFRVERAAAVGPRISPVVMGAAAVVLLLGALAVARSGDGTDEPAVRASAEGVTTPKTRSSTVVPSSSSSAPATSDSATSTTAPEGASDDAGLTLPPADPNGPPQAPFGIFTGGKLYLRGSVPSVEVAEGYQRKAIGVLGAGNVVVEMTLDPRAPAGPARVIVEEQFIFPENSAAIDPKFDRLLAIGAYALEKVPESTLVITGHTDSVGSADYNQQLSEQRAQIIVDYMVSKGIPADRIVAVGRGEAEPIADNGTPEGRARNRRIEGTLEGIMP